MQQQQKEKQNSAKNKYINIQPSLLTKRTEIRILYIITFCISLYIYTPLRCYYCCIDYCFLLFYMNRLNIYSIQGKINTISMLIIIGLYYHHFIIKVLPPLFFNPRKISIHLTSTSFFKLYLK